MTLQQATSLIRNDEIDNGTKGVWADLGCGAGIFTNALASLLSKGSLIYAIDKNMASFQMDSSNNHVSVTTIELNFEDSTLPLRNMNGILMANSLHFVENKKAFLEKMKYYLHKNGYFLIVEYDTDIANQWVPYPVSFLRLKKIFNDLGYSTMSKIGEMPSVFNRRNIYSALIQKQN